MNYLSFFGGLPGDPARTLLFVFQLSELQQERPDFPAVSDVLSPV